MTFPAIDSRDFVTNPETSRPPETPQTVWVVYYLGNSGSWLWSYPTFYYENAVKQAECLDRPTRILEYALVKDTVFERIVKKIAKVVRKVRQVAE